MHLLLRPAFAVCLFPFAGQAATLETHKINPKKELLITDVAVVDSPLARFPGPFSFGHLTVKMAGANDPSEFLKRWLFSWEKNHTVNGHPLPARKKIRELLIDPWKEKDGFAGRPDHEWDVDFRNAPFRLLAIVNRTDLAELPKPPEFVRGRGGYFALAGSVREISAGEGRFVFAALDPKGNPLPGDFTIILEYRLQVGADEIGDTARWARDWHALGKLRKFDGEFLHHLATLTNHFTAGALPPAPPGTERRRGDRDTPLRQLRTNEASLDPEREFREFKIGKDGFLEPSTLAATPAVRFEKFRITTDDNKALAQFIDENAEEIKTGRVRFPKNVLLKSGERAPFLAARSLIPEDGGRTFHWDARFVRDKEARRVFSFNTCNGCHAAETATDSCLHIHPRIQGEPAKLSKFLRSSIRVANPENRLHKVHFNEMDRRANLLRTLLDPDLSFQKMQKLKREPGTIRASH